MRLARRPPQRQDSFRLFRARPPGTCGRAVDIRRANDPRVKIARRSVLGSGRWGWPVSIPALRVVFICRGSY
eukprot:9155781-Pyramimonas_sp.AAC.1